MVVGGQYDGDSVPSSSSLSLLQMLCESHVFYFCASLSLLNAFKQYVLFNSPQHFCAFLSFPNALSG